ncbi:hypothetical protein GCM10007416_32370 [Kroppenstedtia guangzhouensis]|uniref:Phage replication protein O n=2 Tax=Kroppenstedtia guangzhouensis TaxID=1274356 RepID=A0ABQ1H383_9BACL|nr:hypothetical protein GCM10007416_32370 [Kroppenstedtia guangzhouensis]
MQGWIQLHRKILKSDMWRNFNAKQRDVTITLLLMASHKGNRWEYGGEIHEVQPGQFVTSLDSIEDQCAKDVSIQNIKTTLTKLKRWGFLDWEPLPNNRGRIITITNWEKYQRMPEDKEQPEPKPEPAPKQKEKDGKEPPEKKSSTPYDIEFENLWQEYPKKKGKAKARVAYRRHRKNGVSEEDFRAALDRYKTEVQQKGTPQQYIKHGSTFFNSGFEDYLEEEPTPDNLMNITERSYTTPGADDTQKYLDALFG